MRHTVWLPNEVLRSEEIDTKPKTQERSCLERRLRTASELYERWQHEYSYSDKFERGNVQQE